MLVDFSFLLNVSHLILLIEIRPVRLHLDKIVIRVVSVHALFVTLCLDAKHITVLVDKDVRSRFLVESHLLGCITHEERILFFGLLDVVALNWVFSRDRQVVLVAV